MFFVSFNRLFRDKSSRIVCHMTFTLPSGGLFGGGVVCGGLLCCCFVTDALIFFPCRLLLNFIHNDNAKNGSCKFINKSLEKVKGPNCFSQSQGQKKQMLAKNDDVKHNFSTLLARCYVVTSFCNI